MTVIEKVERDFGLRVFDTIELSKMLGEDDCRLKENCYIIGNDIYLGEYEDQSVRLASFFHEVGHWVSRAKVNKNKTITIFYSDGAKETKKYGSLGEYQYILEKDAWDKGMETAKKYGCDFSEAALVYMKKCLDNALKYRG